MERGGGYVKKQNLWEVRKKTEILGGYQNLSRHGKKLLFIYAATRREIPLQQGIIASCRE